MDHWHGRVRLLTTGTYGVGCGAGVGFIRGCSVTVGLVGLADGAGLTTSEIGLVAGRGFIARFAGAATSFTLKLAIIVASAAPVFRFTAAG